MKWIRQVQEQEGSYFFSGQFFVTQGIQSSLTQEEILAIYLDVRELAEEKNGIDYLVVYIHKETKQKLFFIDQLNKEMIESGEYKEEHNLCTLMIASEY